MLHSLSSIVDGSSLKSMNALKNVMQAWHDLESDVTARQSSNNQNTSPTSLNSLLDKGILNTQGVPYSKDVIVESLIDRLRQLIFLKCFLSENAFPKTAVEKLTKDAKTFLAASRTMLIPVLEKLPPLKADFFKVSLTQENYKNFLLENHLKLQEMLLLSEKEALRFSQETINSCREGQRSLFDNALLISNQLVAGSIYLEKLESVLKELQHELCYKFFSNKAAAHCQKKIGEKFLNTASLANLPLSPFHPLNIVREMVARIEEKQEIIDKGSSLSIIKKICISTVNVVEEHLNEKNQIKDLIEKIIVLYEGAISDLMAQMTENENQQRLLKNFKSPEPSLIKRFFSRGTQETVQKIEIQLDELDQEAKKMQATLIWINQFIQDFFEQVLGPYLIRDRIIDEIRSEYQILSEELSAFHQAIQKVWETDKSYEMPFEERSMVTWLDNPLSDIINQLRGTHCSDKILTYLPSQKFCMSTHSMSSSTDNFRTLKDFFNDNPTSFANHLTYYAADLLINR